MQFAANFDSLPANQAGIAIIGVQRLAAPLALDALGMTGCSLYASPAVNVAFGSGAAGSYALVVTVPGDPALLGGEFFVQAAVASPSSNPAGLITTAAGAGVIGL
jgi:hypothetical protein